MHITRTTLAAVALLAVSCLAEAKDDVVTVTFQDGTASVKGVPKGVTVKTEGADVTIDNPLTDKEFTFLLEGKSQSGSLSYKGKFKATFVLNGLELRNVREGAAISLNCGKRMKLKVAEGTRNVLEDAADTLHKACLYTRGHLEITGGGELTVIGNSKNGIAAKEYVQIKRGAGKIAVTSDSGNGINAGEELMIEGGQIDINVSGKGGKGIRCGGDLTIDGKAEVNVTTSGSYVAEKDFGFGGPPPMGDFEMNDSLRAEFEKMRPPFPPQDGDFPQRGGFPPPPSMGGEGFPGAGPQGPPNGQKSNIDISDTDREKLFADVQDLKEMPAFGKDGGMQPPQDGAKQPSMKGGMSGGPGGKHKYQGAAKAVKVIGTARIKGGNVHLETTGDGAEGLEGKKGVEVSGGKLYIKACDDAINSNGKIIFSGGDSFVWSTGNDAIDSNSREAGAITISGGTVVACSQIGPPEEAFDCDFSPMLLTGGTVFGMGGSMTGEATAPADSDDTQPTVVLSGLPLPKGMTLIATDDNGRELFSFDIPFSMRSSSSILSLPAFAKGKTYSVRLKQPDLTLKTFTFEKTVVK